MQRDIEDAAAWDEQQHQGLGRAFVDNLREALQAIVDQPGVYPLVHRRTRRALAHRFPFGIHYRVEAEKIVVIAVMHGSRDPRRWQTRT
ncbi:MAG: type II toxin-antitoxin system RelE/ParE family toxin [Rhodanobacteraceae bacterium]